MTHPTFPLLFLLKFSLGASPETSSPECAPVGRGLKQVWCHQASSVAFLPACVHLRDNEGRGRGPGASTVNYGGWGGTDALGRAWL